MRNQNLILKDYKMRGFLCIITCVGNITMILRYFLMTTFGKDLCWLSICSRRILLKKWPMIFIRLCKSRRGLWMAQKVCLMLLLCMRRIAMHLSICRGLHLIRICKLFHLLHCKILALEFVQKVYCLYRMAMLSLELFLRGLGIILKSFKHGQLLKGLIKVEDI